MWLERSVLALLLALAVGTPFRVELQVSLSFASKVTAPVVLEIDPAWAPLGAERFKQLVEADYFSECFIHRVVPGFVAQFGINGDPKVSRAWREKKDLQDDPFLHSNARGTISFATSGPNTRSTQLFINLKSNPQLDDGFAPIGRVVSGMKTVDAMFKTGDNDAPDQGLIQRHGNEYLRNKFRELSVIRKAAVVQPPAPDLTKPVGVLRKSTSAMPPDPGRASLFSVRCTLARGLSLDIRVNRKWAPLGAARFEELVRAGWLDRTPLYRAVPNFLVQFGLNASSSQRWGPISDDSKAHSPKHFARGMVSFAGSGPNSRDTEMFIAFAAVSSLGQAPWETPFGMVTRDTLHVLDQVNTEYGDMPPWGTGPNPSKIRSSPDYLANSYPNIDYWQECHVLATSTSDDTATDL